MNHFSLQQNAVLTSSEETRGLVSMSDLKGPLVCPKPRRVGVLATNSTRPLRWNLNHQADMHDSSVGSDLLDLILKKEGGYGSEQSASQAASSPPFFCGSPPTRAANPLIQDARFGEEKLIPMSPLSIPSPSSGISSPSSAHKGGCVRVKFGPKPAAVRIEGFDCLDRDRKNSSIPAVA